MFGILVIDKPLEMTSHDVVYHVRKRLKTKKVGHAGTLDPLASGVLVVAVGPATRFIQYLPLEPKEYAFSVKFGQTSNTQDAEGELSEAKPVPKNLEQLLEEALPQFRGEIEQLPPLFSAIKKNGKPLYFYARKGEEVERDTRKVTIHRLELLKVTSDEAEFVCECSAGTYIRALAHDLGQNIGCGGYLSSLRRTAVGKFKIESSIGLDSVDADQLLNLSEALEPMEKVVLPREVEARIRDGQKVPVRPVPESDRVTMVDGQNRVVGIASLSKGSLQPECIVPAGSYENLD